MEQQSLTPGTPGSPLTGHYPVLTSIESINMNFPGMSPELARILTRYLSSERPLTRGYHARLIHQIIAEESEPALTRAETEIRWILSDSALMHVLWFGLTGLGWSFARESGLTMTNWLESISGAISSPTRINYPKIEAALNSFPWTAAAFEREGEVEPCYDATALLLRYAGVPRSDIQSRS
jgi:hypothetical protein